MTPFAFFLRRTAATSLHPMLSRDLGMTMQRAEESDLRGGFYHSSNDLLSGLEVTEHSAPPALMGLLREALAA